MSWPEHALIHEVFTCFANETRLVDVLDGTSYLRDGDELAADGLYVSLEPYGAHRFRVENAGAGP